LSDLASLVRRVEALEDLPLDPDLAATLAAGHPQGRPIRFYVPTFKHYQTSEVCACEHNAWPALSITGSECRLQCDHCKAKVLEPMIPVTTPEALWARVNALIEGGARGMLLSGGSNHRDEVEYDPFYPVIRRIKDAFPAFRIAVHTALVDAAVAARMEDAGIDIAMLDIIGDQRTVTQVYHLKRPVADFEASLAALVGTSMKVVPHIVLGLHYGRLLGEWEALRMVARQRPDALVLVVVMPFYAPPKRPFAVPDAHAVGRFFLDARRALRGLPLLLGCARPPGMDRALVDSYAVLAGLDGIAHPAEGVVELARRLGRPARVVPACCSVAVGEEVLALTAPEEAVAPTVQPLRFVPGGVG
jgi:uncharacterized radical SAM superfamily protein